MYSVEIKIKFRSGHRLMPPYTGKCLNPHGEGYTAIFIFSTESLDENGMVLDFGSIKEKLKTWIDDNFDHAYLHKNGDEVGIFLKEKGFRTFEFQFNPTAENMARYFYNMAISKSLPITKVGVVESFCDSVAWYEEKA